MIQVFVIFLVKNVYGKYRKMDYACSPKLWLQIAWNDLSNAADFAQFRVRMSELAPLKVGQLAGKSVLCGCVVEVSCWFGACSRMEL
uniref:Uncharacterized protein n=1 Tax=Solanum tuberosum TaxID=4113 RepID=M1DUQ5_SOLTU